MKKLNLIILLGIVTVIGHAENINKISKSTEDSITKDFDQDGKYSPYEKSLRGAQKSVYVTLPAWIILLSAPPENKKTHI